MLSDVKQKRGCHDFYRDRKERCSSHLLCTGPGRVLFVEGSLVDMSHQQFQELCSLLHRADHGEHGEVLTSTIFGQSARIVAQYPGKKSVAQRVCSSNTRSSGDCFAFSAILVRQWIQYLRQSTEQKLTFPTSCLLTLNRHLQHHHFGLCEDSRQGLSSTSLFLQRVISTSHWRCSRTLRSLETLVILT